MIAKRKRREFVGYILQYLDNINIKKSITKKEERNISKCGVGQLLCDRVVYTIHVKLCAVLQYRVHVSTSVNGDLGLFVSVGARVYVCREALACEFGYIICAYTHTHNNMLGAMHTQAARVAREPHRERERGRDTGAFDSNCEQCAPWHTRATRDAARMTY